MIKKKMIISIPVEIEIRKEKDIDELRAEISQDISRLMNRRVDDGRGFSLFINLTEMEENDIANQIVLALKKRTNPEDIGQ